VCALSLYVFIGKPPAETASESGDDEEQEEKPLKRSLLAREKQRLVLHAAGRDYAGYGSTPRLLGHETYQMVNGSPEARKVQSLGTQPDHLENETADSADVVMSNLGDEDQSIVYSSSKAPPRTSNPIDAWSKRSKRNLGMVLAVISGVFYGTNFNPPQHIMDYGTDCHPAADNTTYNLNRPGCADPNGLDYVFPHFCGIYLASSVYFLVYCVYMKNKPRIYPQAILPGYISGLMWATAQTSWFVANASLGMPLAFPLINSGPGLIAALWGVFVFKEIKGSRDFSILGCAFTLTLASCVCISLSH